MRSTEQLRVNGAEVLRLRLSRNLTQREVAERVGIGMRTYRRYERSDFAHSGYGQSRLEHNQILAYIAQFFTVPVERLLVAVSTKDRGLKQGEIQPFVSDGASMDDDNVESIARSRTSEDEYGTDSIRSHASVTSDTAARGGPLGILPCPHCHRHIRVVTALPKTLGSEVVSTNV
jgi:transcriptional regulator with XRE-family HTH domain